MQTGTSAHFDVAARRAAVLASPEFFVLTGMAGPIVFACMQAGHGVTHAIAYDTRHKALHCSCAFHPKPCIHARALVQLFETTGNTAFAAVETTPEWVEHLLSGAASPLEIRNETSEQAKEAARDKRRFDRLERAAHGMEDLENWLLDTLRRGLATTLSEDPSFFASIATRAADASMTGISRALRLLSNMPASDPAYLEHMTETLADCYLAVRAFGQRASLSEPLVYDLQGFIGLTQKKEEVLRLSPPVNDTWTVLGQTEMPVEDKLQARKTWLWGIHSEQFALILEYVFGDAGFQPGLKPGSQQRGALVYYPSAWPQRALVVDSLETLAGPAAPISGYTCLADMATGFARALGLQPWIAEWPAILQSVVPCHNGNIFYLSDTRGDSVTLNIANEAGWKLMAVGGGQPITVFGLWNGSVMQVRSIIHDGGLFPC